MSDFFLFAVFGLLFCMESILLSGKGTVIIYSHFLKKWSFIISDKLPFFAGKHISLKSLFPPLGAAFITGSCPVVISSEGILLNPYEGRYRPGAKNSYRYSEIKTIGVSGTSLRINGTDFCSMHTDSEALWWKDKLLSVTKISEADRLNIINKINSSMFDIDSAEKLIEKIFSGVRPLRITVNLFYIFLFAAAPCLVILYSFENILIPLLLIIAVFHFTAVYFFYKAYRYIFNERGFPWAAIISMALFPPALIRSMDYFYKDSMLHYNTAVVALILIHPEHVKKILSFLLREYIYFSYEFENDFEQKIASNHREIMLESLKLLFNKRSVSADELLIPPPQCDDIKLYCPRCFDQYIDKVCKCEECNLELKRY